MYYALTHLTRFTYSEPITASVMEVQMQPRSDRNQRCIEFDMTISPPAHVMVRRNYLGNTVHVFDIPGRHSRIAIKTDATVEVKPLPDLPDAVSADAWDEIDAQVTEDRDLYDMLLPSRFAKPTDMLLSLADELNVNRDGDPLSTLRRLNTDIYETFEYIQNITRADSPIDEALERRVGVCQDFAHVMIALARHLGIPCRYISGYLYHRTDRDRSAADATHAWVEAWLPEHGWVGFDPTNNTLCNVQHIRVAIGRDYHDVPPTNGVYIGDATSELEVEVAVDELDELPPEDSVHAPQIQLPSYEILSQQQQQQQQ